MHIYIYIERGRDVHTYMYVHIYTHTCTCICICICEAAAQNGWIDRDKVISESLLSFKSAGCAGILTYYAIKMAEILDSPI